MCYLSSGHKKSTRQTDGSIVVTIYRKPTNTDKYRDFDSHHHVQHKRAVAQTLLDRATSIPSTDEEKTAEVQRVTATLKANAMAIRHGSLTIVNAANHTKDRGTRQSRVIWSYFSTLKAPLRKLQEF